MYLKTATLVAGVMLAFSAHAGGHSEGNNGNATSGNISSNASYNANSNANRNSNRNTNAQGQQQGQRQAQGQSQRSSSVANNRATGGAGGASSQGQSLSGGANNSAQSVNVGGDQFTMPQLPVATAYAPNIAPTAVCMGASSAGVQGMSFGLSLGSSWTDSNCMFLEKVRTVAVAMNDLSTAAEMMCGDEQYREARARTGHPCGSTAALASSAPVNYTPQQERSGIVYTDPIIRARLGLPPLN